MTPKIRFWQFLKITAILLLACSTSITDAAAQTAFYTFTSGPSGDGFVWDFDDPPFGANDLPNTETFFAPGFDEFDVINFENFTENVNFFDSNYQAAGNSTVINGDAWWGNPIDDSFTTVGAAFFNTINGSAESVSFDFAWATAGQEAPGVLEIEAYDTDGDFALLLVGLENTFNAGPAFGGFDGWEGNISFDLAELQFDNADLDNIEGFQILLSEISTLGGSSEFAIDNLSIDGGAGNDASNIFPSFSSGMNGSGVTFGRNVLKDTGIITISQEITNDGPTDTTFSTQIVPGGDLTDPGQVSGVPILAGSDGFVPQLATFDSNALSGEYASDFRFINDSNPLDPDDTLTHTVRIHDAPQLTDNSGATVQVDNDAQLFISNAAAGPHDGALRAGVKIANRGTVGLFTFTTPDGDLENDEVVGAGETRMGTVEFNRFGQLNGVYAGTASVELTMVSNSGFFLTNAQPVPDVSWNLEYDLATNVSDSIAVGSDETLGPSKVGVNNATTAGTIVDGISTSAQTIGMELANDPEQGDPTKSADLATDGVNVHFTTDADLYVLQITYAEGHLPSGITEQQLQLLVFDALADDWMLAIDANADGGSGGLFFDGSYSSFLSGPGGGLLDPSDLSSYGVDSANNMAWAVLDHASLFSLGMLGTVGQSADTEPDGDVDGADFLAIQRDDPALISFWESQYGNSAPLAASQAVPEPTSLALILCALAINSLCRSSSNNFFYIATRNTKRHRNG